MKTGNRKSAKKQDGSAIMVGDSFLPFLWRLVKVFSEPSLKRSRHRDDGFPSSYSPCCQTGRRFCQALFFSNLMMQNLVFLWKVTHSISPFCLICNYSLVSDYLMDKGTLLFSPRLHLAGMVPCCEKFAAACYSGKLPRLHGLYGGLSREW